MGCTLIQCCNQDSFRGRRDFEKAWLSGARETALRTAVGKVCDGIRFDFKDEVCRCCDYVRRVPSLITPG